jgi:hypothetical protein
MLFDVMELLKEADPFGVQGPMLLGTIMIV